LRVAVFGTDVTSGGKEEFQVLFFESEWV